MPLKSITKKSNNNSSSNNKLLKMAFLLNLWGTTSRQSNMVARAFSSKSAISNRLRNRVISNRMLTHAVSKSYSASLFSSSNRMFPVSTDHQFAPNHGRRFFSARLASVEEDLDSALDDILGGVEEVKEVKEVKEVEEVEMNGNEEEEYEEIKIDYKDPKFLSITNPFWKENGMIDPVINALSEKGISQLTPVQAEAFIPALAGSDIIGRSRTGTGKTLAFGIPAALRLDKIAREKNLLDRNGRRPRGRLPSMLVLCPTRELARQVQDEISQIGRPMGLYVDCFHGGVSYDPQARALRDGIDILVGTPGRVMDHLNRGNLRLSQCHTVVLDEADEMLNMGFAEDVEEILEGVGEDNEEKTQCLLFSATTPPWVKEIGKRYQDDDVVMIDSTGNDAGARTAKTVRHVAIQVPPGPDSRKSILEDIIAVEISRDFGEGRDADVDESNVIAAAALEKKKKSHGAMQQKIFGKTIVFTETKREADELVSGGVFKSLTAQALHGDVGQKQRDATLNAFRAGSFNVLVATDVAARGIDISDVDVVVQFGPPRDTGKTHFSFVHCFTFRPTFLCVFFSPKFRTFYATIFFRHLRAQIWSNWSCWKQGYFYSHVYSQSS